MHGRSVGVHRRGAGPAGAAGPRPPTAAAATRASGSRREVWGACKTCLHVGCQHPEDIPELT